MQPGSPRDADLTDNIPGSLGYLSELLWVFWSSVCQDSEFKVWISPHVYTDTQTTCFIPEKLPSKKKIWGNKGTGSNSRQAALQQSFNISNPIPFFCPAVTSFRGTLSRLVKDINKVWHNII